MLSQSNYLEMPSTSAGKFAQNRPTIDSSELGSMSPGNESGSFHTVPENIGQFKVWERSFLPKSLPRFEGEKINRQMEGITNELFNFAVLSANRKAVPKPLTYFLTRKQAQILCTLLPDEIIHKNDPPSKEVINFVGVLLFADVCGFTSVCEKFTNTGKGGTYRLSATLNAYIGAMVEVIYAHGGDVLKFSGDSFLAFWKLGTGGMIYDLIHKVIKCGLHIQSSLGSYETDVNVCLRVKLAISAGNLSLSVIGDEESRHYICVGTPVYDVKSAERSCSSGEIVLSPSAWTHCSSKNYDYSLKDEFHVKVSQILADPSKSKDQVLVKSPLTDDITIAAPTRNAPLRKSYLKINKARKEKGSYELGKNLGTNLLRKPVTDFLLCNLGPILRPFLIPPVVQQVDADQPLEFLSEMRQVTTLFINIIPQALPSRKLILMVDEAYCIVCRLMRKYSGCVNKVTLFDKDVTILCVFGLRGYKLNLVCQTALVCALKVQQSLEALKPARHVSIGLTTGMAYCGVVGHPLRREYTVIGGTVNMAARMMCAYPQKVTCDLFTYQRSKLPVDDFILQEPRELKGLDTVLAIYEYTKCQGPDSESASLLPLLGRKKEMKTFVSMLEHISKPEFKHGGLVIKGEPRIGKSRLLEEFVIEAKTRNLATVHVSLDSFHANTPFSAAYLVIKQLLGLKENSSMREREEKLFAALGKDKIETLCYLNDVLQVQFPNNLGYLASGAQSRQEKAIVVFQDILKLGLGELLLCFDDVQYMDAESWQLICPVLYHERALMVLAVSEDEQLSPTAAAILAHEYLLHVKLEGIKEPYVAPLACQILQVEAVSSVIDDLLQSRSKGNPGWCESFLLSLLQNGGLKKITANYKNADLHKLVIVDRKHIVPARPELVLTDAEDDSDRPRLSSLTACIIAKNFDIKKQILPKNIDEIIMQTFDSLPPYEQLLLKCAAVLGVKFSRKMLFAVLPRPVLREIAFAVLHLFEMRILVCTAPQHSQSRTSLSRSNRSSLVGLDVIIECYCHGLGANEMFSDWFELPKYAFCTNLRFALPAFRDKIYELLLDNQKVEFHSRAVEFLVGQARRCAACGGGGFAINPGLEFDGSELQNKSRSRVSSSRRSAADEMPDSALAVPSTSRSDQLALTRMAEFRIMSEKKNDSGSLTTVRAEDVHSSKGQYKALNINSRSTVQNTDSADALDTNGRRRSSLLSRMFGRGPKEKKRLSFQSISWSFLDSDFRYCECPLVLSEVYSQIIEHCRAAGLVAKHIRFLVEYGAASNLLGKNTLAVQLLMEAKDLALPLAQFNLRMGKIYSLIGKSYLDMGCCKKSKKYIFLSLSKLGFPFRQRNRGLQLRIQGIAQYFHQMFSDTLFIPKLTASNTVIYEEVASTMALLCNVFMVEQEWGLAKLAALRSLNLAQRCGSNLPILCAAYSNLMDVYHHYGEHDYCRKLEEYSLRNCQDNYHIQVAEDLLALGRLYCATFMSRLQRGEISSAIKIGFRILQISSRVYASNVKLFVLPLLVQALLLHGRVGEATDLLRELEFCAGHDQDNSSTAWFHALCLDLLLDAGVALEPGRSCLAFSKAMASDSYIIRDVDVKKRLVVASWQWCIRRGEWKLANVWWKLAQNYLNDIMDNSFCGLITSLKLLECLLVTMVTSVNRDEPAQVEVYRHKLVEPLLSKLRKQSKWTKVIHPRYLHLKAYSSITKRHKSRAFQILTQAKQISILHGNVLDEAWIDHSTKVWSGQVNKVDQDFWIVHSSSDAHIDCQELVLHDWSKIMFTLPLENR